MENKNNIKNTAFKIGAGLAGMAGLYGAASVYNNKKLIAAPIPDHPLEAMIIRRGKEMLGGNPWKMPITDVHIGMDLTKSAEIEVVKKIGEKANDTHKKVMDSWQNFAFKKNHKGHESGDLSDYHKAWRDMAIYGEKAKIEPSLKKGILGVYHQSQEILPPKVVLYRGISGASAYDFGSKLKPINENDIIASHLSGKTHVEINHRPISGWTSDQRVAKEYSNGSGGISYHREFDKKQIVAGFGITPGFHDWAAEHEYLVKADKHHEGGDLGKSSIIIPINNVSSANFGINHKKHKDVASYAATLSDKEKAKIMAGSRFKEGDPESDRYGMIWDEEHMNDEHVEAHEEMRIAKFDHPTHDMFDNMRGAYKKEKEKSIMVEAYKEAYKEEEFIKRARRKSAERQEQEKKSNYGPFIPARSGRAKDRYGEEKITGQERVDRFNIAKDRYGEEFAHSLVRNNPGAFGLPGKSIGEEIQDEDNQRAIKKIIIIVGLGSIAAMALYKWYQKRKADKAKVTQEEIEAKAKELKSLKDPELKEALKSTTTLLPHQQRVIDKLEQNKGVLAYHGMGSGKSLTSIASMIDDHPDVIVPASLRTNYQKEIDKHTTGMKANIMSYEKATRHWDPVEKKWIDSPVTSKAMIMDEPQAIGQSATERSMVLVDKAKQYEKRLLMTGTPIRNHPVELSPLINAVMGSHALPTDRNAFESRFTKPIMSSPGIYRRVMKGERPEEIGREIKNADKLAEIIRGHVDYHMPAQTNFPSHSEETIKVTMNKEQHNLYKMAEKDIDPLTAYKIRQGLPPSKRDTIDLNKFMGNTRQIGNTGKMFGAKEDSPKIVAAVAEYKKRHDADPNFRGMVYSNFLGSGLREYSAEMNKHGLNHAVFDGTMNDKQRQKVVNDYNNGKIKGLLISGAGAQGLDLKGTKLVQILEPHWNSARIEQAKARAIRYMSHDHLHEDERHVHVQNFHSVLPEGIIDKIKAPYEKLKSKITGDPVKKPLSADEFLHKMNDTKDKLNNQFLDVLKKVGSEHAHVKKESAYNERMDNLDINLKKEHDNLKYVRIRAAMSPKTILAGAASGAIAGYGASTKLYAANQLLGKKKIKPLEDQKKVITGGSVVGGILGGISASYSAYKFTGDRVSEKNISNIQKQKEDLEAVQYNLLKRLGREPTHWEVEEELIRFDNERAAIAAERAAASARAKAIKKSQAGRDFQTFN